VAYKKQSSEDIFCLWFVVYKCSLIRLLFILLVLRKAEMGNLKSFHKII
jgi:hypothetical protein